MKIIRVFPSHTNHTPRDEFAFVGDPPLLRPEADAVYVSVVFTWDIPEAMRLVEAWKQHYPLVRYGGPAFGDPGDGFTPGLFVKSGVVFTSRGCQNSCSFCLVPHREGSLRLLPIQDGYIVGDNNLLQTPSSHRLAVWQMLNRQRRYAVLSGGLQASLVTDETADELRGLRLDSVFLAADSEGALKPLATATKRLSFLPRRKLRCYVLCAHRGETVQQAAARLERVWELGAMPFCQLYQPPSERRLEYSAEWRALQRKWSRPAAMIMAHKETGVPA